MLPPRNQRQQMRQLRPNRRRIQQIKQDCIRLRQHRRRLKRMIHHNQPPQQQALHRQRRLQPADAHRRNGAQRMLARHFGHRVQIAQDRAETSLVQQAWSRDEAEQFIERIRQEAAVVRERAEVVYSWFYEGAARLGGQLGCCIEFSNVY